MSKRNTKQTRIDWLDIPEKEPELSPSDEEDLYRFLRGGLGAK